MKDNDTILFYLDETGDHSLEKVDKDFPIFVLTVFVVSQNNYINNIIPAANKIRFDFWGHEGIIFHSRDIRKALFPFNILQNKSTKELFLEAISNLMKNSEFNLIVSVIKKEKLKSQYLNPYNPYDLALKFILERIIILLKNTEQKNVTLIAECRGKNEDDSLRLSFLKIINNGTEKINKSVFADYNFILKFLPKSNNVLGTQLADLSGYPIGRKVLFPDKENKAYDLIEPKILRKIDKWDCFKIFP